jgi:hypothetical protein
MLPFRQAASRRALEAFVTAASQFQLAPMEWDAILLPFLSTVDRHARRLPTCVERFCYQIHAHSETDRLTQFAHCVDDVLRYRGDGRSVRWVRAFFVTGRPGGRARQILRSRALGPPAAAVAETRSIAPANKYGGGHRCPPARLPQPGSTKPDHLTIETYGSAAVETSRVRPSAYRKSRGRNRARGERSASDRAPPRPHSRADAPPFENEHLQRVDEFLYHGARSLVGHIGAILDH